MKDKYERKRKIAEKSAGNSGKDPGNGMKNDAHIHPERTLVDVFKIDAQFIRHDLLDKSMTRNPLPIEDRSP